MMWPPPQISDPSPPAAKATAKAALQEKPEPNYFNDTLKDSFMYTSGMGGVVGTSLYFIAVILGPLLYRSPIQFRQFSASQGSLS